MSSSWLLARVALHGTMITRVSSIIVHLHYLPAPPYSLDSAYIHISGLDYELTEGDVIVIFSQYMNPLRMQSPSLRCLVFRYGEVMDVNLPRDKNTGKTRGFAFLMYEDQRSTVLAVDNLNGATVRNRTLKVDHVKNYKQPKVKGEDGEFQEQDEQSLNAKPELTYGVWFMLEL